MSDKPHDRILRAAVRLYAREGIQTVGMTRVIAEADVAPTTLYRQFRGKDRLVAAALRRWSADWLDWLRRRTDQAGGDLPARPDALWRALAEWFAAEDFRGSFVAGAAAELRGRPDHPAHQAIAEHRAALRELLAGLSSPDGPVDPAVLADQLLVLVDGAVAIATVDHRPDAAARASRLAAALLGEGTDPGSRADATPAGGPAFCRGRPNGAAGAGVAARTAASKPRPRRP